MVFLVLGHHTLATHAGKLRMIDFFLHTTSLVSISLVIYTVLLYPLVIILIGAVFGRRRVFHDFTPNVSLIIAASNERDELRRSLTKTLELDYPPGLVEFIVVTDDGSSAETINIISEFTNEGVRHLHSPNRGKNACLDFAVARASGDVLVFKDATGVFSFDALRRLTEPYQDNKIGCVGGVLQYKTQGDLGSFERQYWLIEERMRIGTEVLGFLPATPGGVHSLRKSIYRSVDNHLVRDMVDPVQALVQGYRVMRADRAICHEVPWTNTSDVFSNRVRCTTRAWAAIAYNLKELWHAGLYSAVFQLVSHKVLRLSLWIPALTFLASTTLLAIRSLNPWIVGVAAAQWISYGLVAIALVLGQRGILVPILSPVAYYVVNFAAMGFGSIRFACGSQSVTWRKSPIESNRTAHSTGRSRDLQSDETEPVSTKS